MSVAPLKITIITAVYNRSDIVAEALDSILKQVYPHIELLLVDGGSTDGTLDVLGRYANQIDKIISEPDEGIYDALNKGLQHASGDVIGFLHADDVFADCNALARVAEAFSDPMLDAVYGDLVYIGSDKPELVVRHWVSGEFSTEKLRKGWMLPHPTLYLRREVYQRLGGFDKRYQIAADYDFIIRLLSEENLRVKYIPMVQVKMRLGGKSNNSFKNMIRKSLEDYFVMRKYGVGGIQTLVFKNLRKLPQFSGLINKF